METFWHMIELAPLGMLLGWGWQRARVRWFTKPTPEPEMPVPDEPTVYDRNPYMVLTRAPVGTGDRPPKAIMAVRHPLQVWVLFDLNERGWPMRYMLIPIGKHRDAEGNIVKHPNPAYNGTQKDGA